MPVNKVKSLLRDLDNIGVFVIELTGGDCLVHPQFKEILKFALSLGFLRINILTNGIALTDEIKRIITENSKRVFLQIDLHSMNDEYLFWFTGVKNTLDIIKENIMELAKNEVSMRIATIVTKRNLNELEKIADWVHALGIEMYAPSPVVKLGRANYSDPDILLSDEEYMQMFDAIAKINKKHEGLIKVLDSDKFRQGPNCGCVSSHVTIDASGEIKICTMDTREFVKGRWGNVFEKNISDIYDEKQDEIIRFSQIVAPDGMSEECRDCDKRGFCTSCLMRGFVASREKGEQCKWYRDILGEEMKTFLFS